MSYGNRMNGNSQGAGVRFAMIESTNTTGNMPTNAANTYSVGINAQGGLVEYLCLRYDLTFGADPCPKTQISQLINSIRVVINGEVVHDFRSGFGANDSVGAGTYDYLLNSIGGRAYEAMPADVKTREGYIGIPLGCNTPTGVNRYEIIVEWKAAAGAIASGSLQWWLKFNTATQKKTTVVPATSFTHSASLEQVVVRVPQNVPGVVSGILVQNDSAADELGTQGIRINSLGDYGLEVEMWRWLNSDMINGILASNPNASTTQQTYETALDGALLIPTYGLTGGDIVLQVDSSAATTRTYTPIITAVVGSSDMDTVRQTQSAPSNTAQTIVARTEN